MWERKFILCLCFFVLLFGIEIAGAEETGLPTVGMTVSNQEISKGSTIEYNISISNNTEKDYEDLKLMVSLPLSQGLSVKGSNRSIEYDSNNQPFWRLGSLEANSSYVVSMSVIVGSGYSQNNISSSAVLTGDSGDGLVSVGSNSVGVIVLSEDKKDDEDVDDKNNENTDEKESKEVNEQNKEIDDEEDLTINFEKASGVDQIDIKTLGGIADLSKYDTNINKWDNKFLYIALVALGLVLIVGIVAYFLGKKSK